MSRLTIDAWEQQEKNSLITFKAEVASRLEEAIFQALTEAMREQLATDGKAEIALPWGTYRAEVKETGEGVNITPTWEPSKGFIKLLNGDDDQNREISILDDFDETFLKYFRNYAAYGFLHPDSDENKDKIPENKGIMLRDDEIGYILNGYANVLATLAKDHQHNGKMFALEINNGYPHGTFEFDYDDDEINVRFVPDKTFKQILKNDEYALRAATADFSPILPGTTRKTVIPTTKVKVQEDDDLKKEEK